MNPCLTNVFDRNLGAYQDGASLVIDQGGQGSSKTFSILQAIYLILKYSKTPMIASVCSYAMPHLKIGAIRDLYQVLTSFGENPGALHNRTDHFFTIGNSTLEYFGIRDNYAKVHGPRRDILYINEANNRVTYDDFDNLYQRTHRCAFLDFNPRSEFWIHDQVMPEFKHTFIQSTFRDNPWLPDAELNKILWKKDKPQFKNWWRVYGEGEVGVLEGQVFQSWEYGDFDTTLPYGYGLDFGYHPDPDAMIKVAIDEKRKLIYLDEKFYSTGQSTGDLKRSVLTAISSLNDLIVADCADPRMIADLKANGGRVGSLPINIKPVKKDGTVSEWLKSLQDYSLVITEGSHNLAKELSNYVWSDSKAGIPIDAFNHLIDAFRYYVMYQKQKTPETFFV